MIVRWGLIFLLSASFLVTIAVFTVDFSSGQTPRIIYQVEPPPTEITCDELYTAYLANGDVADRIYKNQRFLFSYI